MKNQNIYKIITILMMISGFVNIWAKTSSEDIRAFEINGRNFKQFTLKGNQISARITGSDDKNITIAFTDKSVKTVDYEKIKMKDIESRELINVKDSLTALLSVNGTEAALDIETENEKTDLFITVPKDISVVFSVKNGNIDLKDIKGEFLIDGKQMNTTVTDCSGVINYKNKSGNLNVINYEGVLNVNTYQGVILLKKMTGSSDIKNVSGNIHAEEISGEIIADVEVGNINIERSYGISIKIENKSGNISISRTKGETLAINSSTGNIDLKDIETGMLTAELTAGEISMYDVKADMNIECNLGEVSVINPELLFKKNSDISVNFGSIKVDLDEPEDFTYYRSVNEKKIRFSREMDVNGDLKICKDNGKCLRLSVKMGEIKIK